MPKLNLAAASQIKHSSGIVSKLKGPNGIVWPKLPMPLGLSSSLLSLTGYNAAWAQRTVDLSDYADHTIRLVWRAVAGTGTSWQNDIQIDSISVDGNTYDFETGVEGFSSSYRDQSGYSSVTWYTVTDTNYTGFWCRDTGNTPSSSTGNLGAQGGSYYLFLESSSPVVAGEEFWLRSPAIALGSSPGSVTFYEGRDTGDNTDATLDFYVDVTAQP